MKNTISWDDYCEFFCQDMDKESLIKERKKFDRQQFEEKHNINRDKRGRLNKGAMLAQKDSCNKDEILLLHNLGLTVKEIVVCTKCSKSTIYNVIKECKIKK